MPPEQSLDTVAVPCEGCDTIEQVSVSPESGSLADGVQEPCVSRRVVKERSLALGGRFGAFTVALTVAAVESRP